MLGLSLGITVKNKVSASAFDILNVSGIKAWYKLQTSISTNVKGNVSTWGDSSGNTSENMNLTATNLIDYNAATGAVELSTNTTGTLATSGDTLNLGAFTIFGVIDLTESGASDEVILGNTSTDEFILYGSGNGAKVGLKANNVISFIVMAGSVPTGKFLFTLTRASNGLITIFINGVSKGTVSSNVTDLFDFLRIGNGSTDSLIYEILIYDNELSSSDRTSVETDINTRNGL
tara:strand:+ start:394 stop:1092 length:699 start_codon:yes stop_codon:yes gene_type:complete